VTSTAAADHIFPDIVPTSDGFFLGSISDKDFCRSVERASSQVKNAIVSRVTWWRARNSPLHHQFIILTVSHSKAVGDGDLPVLYDLRVERVGKGIGFRGVAEHKITSSLARPLQSYTAANKLMFGLLAEDASAPDVIGAGLFCTKSAFLDMLDDKWRGPPAKLWHIARYIEYIVALAPRYRLASTNCYYFARLLMYAIGLRHYSFPVLAAGGRRHLVVRSQRHDPSGISILFQFLRQEEESSGVLLYAKINTFVQALTILLLVGGLGAGTSLVWVHHGRLLALATFSGGIFIAFKIYWVLVGAADSRVIEPSRSALREEAEALVAKLGLYKYSDHLL
jgi:hypothetical protein